MCLVSGLPVSAPGRTQDAPKLVMLERPPPSRENPCSHVLFAASHNRPIVPINADAHAHAHGCRAPMRPMLRFQSWNLYAQTEMDVYGKPVRLVSAAIQAGGICHVGPAARCRSLTDVALESGDSSLFDGVLGRTVSCSCRSFGNGSLKRTAFSFLSVPENYRQGREPDSGIDRGLESFSHGT